MQIPHPVRPTVDIALTPPRGGRPGGPLRRPQTYEEEILYRHLQQEQDEQYARHLQDWREDERDNDFREGFGDITALGNATGHFLNDDFRLRGHKIAPPQHHPPPNAPTVPSEAAPMFDRAPASDYVHDVSRARGVRASSLTRLADRFTMRGPPPLPTASTMPAPALTAAMGLMPGPQIRRNTVETGEVSTRTTAERPAARVVMRPVVYDEPEEITVGQHPKPVPVVRKQHVREPPKGPVLSSALAGLTKGGSYQNRVHEWRMYVGGGGCTEPAAEIAS